MHWKRDNPYPYDFHPTFHKYRLDEPARKTKGVNIFVCSMADLFGDWVPDKWIKGVFEACEKASQHRYLFLTKNPKRYTNDNDSKYEKYFDVCHRMYIACPAGMIAKDELPPKIGLITRNENGWYVVKAAKRNNPKDFNIDFVLSLLYRGYEETLEQRKLRDRIVANDNVSLKHKAKNIGYEIARRLDKDRETQVEEWISDCADIFKEYLGIDINNWGRGEGLPDLYDLKGLLKSVSGTLKEVNNIRKIGEYLRRLDLPEESEKHFNNSLKKLREDAMNFEKIS